MLAKQFMCHDTLAILRARFSPEFDVSEKDIRHVLYLFNRCKAELPSKTFQLLVDLLLKLDFSSKSLANQYDHIMISGRIHRLLRDHGDLAYKMMDLIDAAANHQDQYLDALDTSGNFDAKAQTHHPAFDGNGSDATELELDIESGYSSWETGLKKPLNPRSPSDQGSNFSPILEFSLSRKLYHKIPSSLHRSSKIHGSKARDRDQFQDLPSSQNEIADSYATSTSRLARGCEHEANVSVPDETCSDKREAGVRRKALRRKHPSRKDDGILGEGTSPKRSRRLGARESDMTLRQVGSHCILIGVKDQVMNTDSSDNTQSESDTTETVITSSQDDEGSLVIDEHPQKQQKTPRKESRARKAKSNLVKVSALCRAAAWLDRQERRRQGNPKEFHSVDLQRSVNPSERENTNNSCSKSESSDMSDEDILKSPLEGAMVGYPEHMPPLIDRYGFSEDSNMTTAGSSGESVASESSRSYVDMSTVERRWWGSHSSQDEPTEYRNAEKSTNHKRIQPLARYLGLQPRQVGTEHTFRGAFNMVEEGTFLDFPTTNGRSVEQRKPSGKGASRKRSKSKKVKNNIRGFDLNFPFTMGGVTATHLSSIAESSTFMGFNSNFQDSSQDSMSCFSDDEMTSTSDFTDRDRAYGLGTFAQDDDQSFLSRLLRSPSPPRKVDRWEPEKHRRRRRHPKKERKPKEPRRSRRLRRKQSQGSEGESSANGSKNGHKSRNCSCCS